MQMIDTGKIARAEPAPAAIQPKVTWVALTQPAQLRYDGTTVQEVQRALRQAFGEFPIKLGTTHLPILTGMLAAAQSPVPYQILYDALERFGEIEVRDR